MITFPTRPLTNPGPTVEGAPAEADPCTCGDHRLVHDDTCLRCGRYPLHTIRETWAHRAHVLGKPDREAVAT